MDIQKDDFSNMIMEYLQQEFQKDVENVNVILQNPLLNERDVIIQTRFDKLKKTIDNISNIVRIQREFNLAKEEEENLKNLREKWAREKEENKKEKKRKVYAYHD